MKKAEAMQRLTECMRLQRMSRNTIKTYSDWLDRYITSLAGSQAETIEAKMGQFLTRIVTQDKVSASTQKQALCAIIYFYKKVLRMEIGDISFLKSQRAVRLPAVFSRQEVWRVLDRLDGEGWLWGALMYGCGLRLEETCQLRVKDVDIDRRLITVREGKGNKDRVVPLPSLLVEPLQKHIRNLEEVHARFAADRVAVSLPDRLDKKYPSAPYSWEWFWIFPSSGPCKDPKWEGKLYHVHNTAVQKRIRRAVLAARIPKKAGCHTFRHSFATHWLENAEGNHEIALKRLQELLGHSSVKTTMVYLHLLPKLDNVTSPLDARPEQAAIRRVA